MCVKEVNHGSLIRRENWGNELLKFMNEDGNAAYSQVLVANSNHLSSLYALFTETSAIYLKRTEILNTVTDSTDYL